MEDNLSKLIKECESDDFEEGFGRIVKNGTRENAEYIAYNYYLTISGTGKTPEEAVSNLLKKRKKKLNN